MCKYLACKKDLCSHWSDSDGIHVNRMQATVFGGRCNRVGVFLELVDTAVCLFEDYVFTVTFCLFCVHSLFCE